MAVSKAKKKRVKMVKEGKRDPQLSRGNWGNLNPIERKPDVPSVKHAKKKENINVVIKKIRTFFCYLV